MLEQSQLPAKAVRHRSSQGEPSSEATTPHSPSANQPLIPAPRSRIASQPPSPPTSCRRHRHRPRHHFHRRHRRRRRRQPCHRRCFRRPPLQCKPGFPPRRHLPRPDCVNPVFQLPRLLPPPSPPPPSPYIDVVSTNVLRFNAVRTEGAKIGGGKMSIQCSCFCRPRGRPLPFPPSLGFNAFVFCICLLFAVFPPVFI